MPGEKGEGSPNRPESYGKNPKMEKSLRTHEEGPLINQKKILSGCEQDVKGGVRHYGSW